MFGLAWLSRPIAYAIGAVLLLLGAWWLVATLTGGKRAKVEAQLNSNIAGANLQSGQDAVQTVGGVQTSAESHDALVRANAAAIDAAQGADAKVDPAAYKAGLAAYCTHAFAKKDPRCAKP